MPAALTGGSGGGGGGGARGSRAGGGRGRGEQFAGLAVEAAGEVVEKFHPAPHRGFAGGPRLDHQGAGGVWFAAGEAQQGFEAEANPIPPDVTALADGGLNLLPQPL